MQRASLWENIPSGATSPPQALPAVILSILSILSILIGWQILKRHPEKSFEQLLFALTIFAALWLIRN